MEYFCESSAFRVTMARMVFRIDPSVVRVWRSPHSVQFGIDEPLAVLDELGHGQERVLDALTVGTGAEGLWAVGEQYGLTRRQVDDVRRALTPVLIDTETPAAPPSGRVSLVGWSDTADEVARLLTAHRVTVTRHRDAASLTRARTVLGVAVGHFVLHPALHSAWLRRDIPHLPVVWGDTGVRIGPLVEPGVSPCLHCLERHRVDTDPAWPMIASQLLDRVSPLESPLRATEAAAVAARAVLTRLGGVPGRATSTRIDADGGVTSEEWERHPECGCHDLAGLVALPGRPRAEGSARRARARRGTATARASRAATPSTTTRAGADAPA